MENQFFKYLEIQALRASSKTAYVETTHFCSLLAAMVKRGEVAYEKVAIALPKAQIFLI